MKIPSALAAFGLVLLLSGARTARAQSDSDWPSLGEQQGQIDRLMNAKAGLPPQTAPAPAAPKAAACKSLAPDPDPNAPLPALGVKSRVEGRSYPSVFAAWSPADNLDLAPSGAITKLDDGLPQNFARHDLMILGARTVGLKPDNTCAGLARGFTPDSVSAALGFRRSVLAANPSAVLLMEIRYRDALGSYLPEDSPWWLRDASGARRPATGKSVAGDYFLLDYSNPDFQKQVALQCRGAIQSGAYDGCMFDWWSVEDPGRLALVKQARGAIGDDALIIVNAGKNLPAGESLASINGYYFEGFNGWWKDINRAIRNVSWGQDNLRAPQIVALEGWYSTSRSAPDDLRLMRAVTTVTLVKSNGYVLFGDSDSISTSANHQHDWYPFWDKGLGRPVGAAVQRPDGAVSREFEGGTVVYNPPTNPAVTIAFDGDRTSRATQARSASHVVASADGDIFLR